MRTRLRIVIASWLIACIGLLVPAFGQQMKPIQLPDPTLAKSMPLMQALKDRKSSRHYKSGSLSSQTLSNLLWAAFGINRPDSGKRTAPSARNRQEIDIYVSTSEGVYLYDPKKNALIPVALGDIRPLTGTQSYVKDAAVNLVYVADLMKMGEREETEKMYFAAADTGFIGQNVYLYCASEGLATVFRASIDRKKLAAVMMLGPHQRITFAQTVGLSQ